MVIATVEQIDRLLMDWQQRVDVMSQALLRFDDLPSYQRLVALSRTASATLDPTGQALLSESQALFEQFDCLINFLHRAQNHRQQHQPLLGKTALATVAALLTEPSIDLPSGERILPETLLSRLIQGHQQLWQALDQWETTYWEEVGALQAAIEDCRQRWLSCRDRYADALILQREYQTKIHRHSPPLFPSEETLLNLQQQLEQLSQLPHAREALLTWQQAFTPVVEAIESSLACYKRDLALRKELRGRLQALQAKAQAKGKIEIPQLCQLAKCAEQGLYSRPTPLDEVELWTQQYEQQLNR